MRPSQQLPCLILTLAGDVHVDFRYPSANGAHLGETDYWLSLQKRVNPEAALFIDGECMHKGAFASTADAVAKLKAMRYARSKT